MAFRNSGLVTAALNNATKNVSKSAKARFALSVHDTIPREFTLVAAVKEVRSKSYHFGSVDLLFGLRPQDGQTVDSEGASEHSSSAGHPSSKSASMAAQS
jgi:hypothetical protein